MPFVNVKFTLSAPNKNSWPSDDLKEICIVGKSNVGKSSFINKLCNNKKLARVSSTPGRTRLLNFFNVNDEFRIVDAPGYGYAKIPFRDDENLGRMMEEYIFQRENAVLFILLLDSRHHPTKDDIFCYDLLKKANKNVLLVTTKFDKLNQSLKAKLKKNIKSAFKDNPTYYSLSINDDKSFIRIEEIILQYLQ